MRPGSFRGVFLFWRSRRTILCLIGFCLSAFAVSYWYSWVPEVALSPDTEARFLPIREILSVVFGAGAVMAMAPRFELWERYRADRIRVLSAVAAVAVAVLAQVVSVIGVAAIPEDLMPLGCDWCWVGLQLNTAVAVGMALALAVLIHPIAGPSLTLLLYAGLVVVQQVLPDLGRFNPLVAGVQEPRWIVAGSFQVVGVALWSLTGGGVLAPGRLRAPDIR